MSGCIYVGCTNYPERLKERILNRPSRFDKRYHIGYPNAEVRSFYFTHKIKKEDLDQIDLNDLVAKTEHLSLAHLGELVKAVFIFGKTIEESVSQLKDMSEWISSTQSENKEAIGFGKKNRRND
jgi:SpoVK/Ycf46/Vps4 family AAA+-type ATPase